MQEEIADRQRRSSLASKTLVAFGLAVSQSLSCDEPSPTKIARHALSRQILGYAAPPRPLIWTNAAPLITNLPIFGGIRRRPSLARRGAQDFLRSGDDECFWFRLLWVMLSEIMHVLSALGF